MTKLRKLRKRKVYRYDVNRKRMQKKMNRLPKIKCDPLKEQWDRRKSTKVNLGEMGLMYDPNQHIKIPSNKTKFTVTDSVPSVSAAKSHIVQELEAEAKAPRQRNFRLPNSQVYWLTQLLDKYGEDYEAMAKDRKLNYFQDTWKQLRHKVRVFKSIPEQYGEYLKKKQEEENGSQS